MTGLGIACTAARRGGSGIAESFHRLSRAAMRAPAIPRRKKHQGRIAAAGGFTAM
jgi:hypothetical protein